MTPSGLGFRGRAGRIGADHPGVTLPHVGSRVATGTSAVGAGPGTMGLRSGCDAATGDGPAVADRTASTGRATPPVASPRARHGDRLDQPERGRQVGVVEQARGEHRAGLAVRFEERGRARSARAGPSARSATALASRTRGDAAHRRARPCAGRSGRTGRPGRRSCPPRSSRRPARGRRPCRRSCTRSRAARSPRRRPRRRCCGRRSASPPGRPGGAGRRSPRTGRCCRRSPPRPRRRRDPAPARP